MRHPPIPIEKLKIMQHKNLGELLSPNYRCLAKLIERYLFSLEGVFR